MPRPGLPINHLVLAEHPVEFWWSTPGVEHPPAIKRVKISARNEVHKGQVVEGVGVGLL
jgi:hypothetical protein